MKVASGSKNFVPNVARSMTNNRVIIVFVENHSLSGVGSTKRATFPSLMRAFLFSTQK